MQEFINSSAGTDESKLMCAMVGDIGGTGLLGCPGTESTLWPALKVFNVGIFTIATLWFSWNILSASVSGGTDGEFIGKRHNNSWVPIRTTVGAGMLVPMFGGFNMAQIIMVWAAAVGSGMASLAADNLMPKIDWGGVYTAPPTMKAMSVEADIVEAAQCVKTWNGKVAVVNAQVTSDPDAGLITWGFALTSNSDGQPVIQFGAHPARGGYNETSCGEFAIPTSSTTVSDPTGARVAQQIKAATVNAVPELVRAYVNVVNNVDDGEQQQKIFKTVRDTWDDKLTQQVKGIVSSANRKSSGGGTNTSSGWVLLGFKPLEDTKIAIEINQATRVSVVKSKGADAGTDSGESKGFLSKASDIGQGVWSFVTHPMITMSKSLAGYIRFESGKNPIAMLQGLGVNVVFWVATTWLWVLMFPLITLGSAAVLAGAAGLAAKIPFIGGAVASAASSALPVIGAMITAITVLLGFLLTIFGVPLIFVGIRLAGILPFTIAIMWTGALMAWLMILVEAMFGAPLWALVHLDMEGEGMGQKSGHGYLFILNLMFRPTILVGSLAVAMAMMQVIFGFFGDNVSGMLTSMVATSDSWLQDILLMIGALFVIVAAAETIMNQSLSLLWNIPNNIFTWIGGQFGSNVGQGMEGVSSNAQGAASSAGQLTQQYSSRGKQKYGREMGLRKAGTANAIDGLKQKFAGKNNTMGSSGGGDGSDKV